MNPDTQPFHLRQIAVASALVALLPMTQAAWGDDGLGDEMHNTSPEATASPRFRIFDSFPFAGDSQQSSNTPLALLLDVPSVDDSKLAPDATNVFDTRAFEYDQLNTRRIQLLAQAPAETEGGDANDLAQKLSNPVASLISVPFQYNTDFNAGTTGRATRAYLNIQPVIPFSLNEQWNLITRTIVPVIYQEQLAPGQSTNSGLGDITMSMFFSPKEPIGGWILGAGPIFLLPTATDTALGGGQWGAGPTVVALQQNHGWTYGILASHTWSFAGDHNRSYVNATYLQPFLTYQFPTATTIGINTESTYDWRTGQWTMPINLFASQLVKLGKQPVSFLLGGRYYAEGPTGAPEWGMRFAMTFVFPK